METGDEEAFDKSFDSNFIINWSCLFSLFKFCSVCYQSVKVKVATTKGTLLIVNLICVNNHSSQWLSQPRFRRQGSENLLLSASVLFSGNTYQRIKEMMDIAKISFLSQDTFYRIQKAYLFSAIHKIFCTHREIRCGLYLDSGESLDLVGDGRCDSPGYNAKYGMYTLMNSKTNEILDCHVVHVGQVANSSRMEKEGLVALLDRFDKIGLSITCLTTDRHTQIRKYMKEQRSDIKHQFDVWHVSKSIKKKLHKASLKKDATELRTWIKSIINHFWWCCASCKGSFTELKEKWLSILFHIKNKHSWKDNEIYLECQHPQLTRTETMTKPWLKEGSPAYKSLENVVRDKYLVNDLRYLVEFKHTGNLEVYHALYNKYCPKRLHFSYAGMIARSQLAILDFNAGSEMLHANTATGELRYKQQYSKKTESWVVKKITAPKDRRYLNDLVLEVKHMAISQDEYTTPKVSNVPTNITPVEKPDKKVSVKHMRTRFDL